MFARPSRDEAQFAGAVQALQNRVHGGEVVRVLRYVEADGQEAIVCVTARAMKPSASRLTAMMATRALDAGAIHMQLTKLNATTAAHSSACHQRHLNVSSNSARVNNQNTTTLPVDSAINGACPNEIGNGDPIEALIACAAEPRAKAAASRPDSTVPKPRNSDAASTSNSATVAPRNAISRVGSSINFPGRAACPRTQ